MSYTTVDINSDETEVLAEELLVAVTVKTQEIVNQQYDKSHDEYHEEVRTLDTEKTVISCPAQTILNTETGVEHSPKSAVLAELTDGTQINYNAAEFVDSDGVLHRVEYDMREVDALFEKE